MGARQKEWARRKRAALIEILGGACARCKCEHSLQLDCIIPQGDRHHRMEFSARVSFYWRQFRAGNLQVLCDRCNSLKGDGPQFPGLPAPSLSICNNSMGGAGDECPF